MTTGLVAQMIAIVRNHISNVWSPPRATKLAGEYILLPGFTYDLQSNDETGEPWVFDKPQQRQTCIQHVMEQKSKFLIGSPICTAFNALQGLSKLRMSQHKWDVLWEKAPNQQSNCIDHKPNKVAGSFVSTPTQRVIEFA